MSDFVELDRPHFTCPLCGHQTPIPEGWEPGDDYPACEGCGDSPEKRRERVLERQRKFREARRAQARITDEDRDLMRQVFEKIDMDPSPFLKTGIYISEVGRQGWMVECSKCGEYFRLFEWSFHGSGKKCPGCGHLYGPGDLYSKAKARRILWGV